MKKIFKDIQSSIKKWEEVKLFKGKSYYKRFWDRCGYCCNFSCEECPLFIRKSTRFRIRYCSPGYNSVSVASAALKAGDGREHDTMAKYVDILLAKMRRDLKRYGK